MKKTSKITFSALCIAIGAIVPEITHFFPSIAKSLSLMHIPTYIAGLICGPLYGGVVGVLSPFISFMLFHMPSGISLYSMIIELLSYGLFAGIFIRIIKTSNNTLNIYISLILSMFIGKCIYGLCNAFIFNSGSYSFNIWISAAFINGIIGIILHLLIVPIIVRRIQKIHQ